MNPYLWETHLHTAESSRCAHDDAQTMIHAYKAAGYHGVIITDHFLNANTTARRKGHWRMRIDEFLLGYRKALAAGNAVGLTVLPGCEFGYRGADFLTFGVDENFWYDQDDLASLDIDAFVRRVHAAGGLVSQAHPYRASWYMPPNVPKRWDIVDDIEVFNGSHSEKERDWDDKALALAEKHHLLQTAGSDAHSLSDVGTAALAFSEPFTSAADFLAALRDGQGEVIRRRT